jgi:ribosomal protein S18 acetylase RimI-like enzyme
MKGDNMSKRGIKIRVMEPTDLGAVAEIDEKLVNVSRLDYFKEKFELLFKSGEYVPTSFVAEDENGKVIGFIMGKLYIGDFGLSNEGAAIDSIGVDPACQRQGIGEKLMDQFIFHLKQLDVKKINTLVDKNNLQMMSYFDSEKFKPSKTVINLERSI